MGVLAQFQPPPAAVSDFTLYVDFNSAATSDCVPTQNGSPCGTTICTGQCAVPTCGAQGTPCHKIQDAINIANCTIGTNTAMEADIVVAAGTYPEKIFIYPNIHLIGAGRDVTTIDAKGLNRAAVIMSKQTCFGFARPGVDFSLTGFRIIHGSGDRIITSDSGGTQFFQMGGGGLLLFGEIDFTPWPVVTDCRIEDNTIANNTGLGAPDWNGAGVYVASGAPIISGNIIQRNTTTPPDLSGQDEALGWGAGIFALNFDCQPVITHNTIRNNVTVAQQGSGGGMYISGEAGTIVSNNYIVANSASIEGGGVYLYVAGASAYNNIVMGNIGAGAGGGFSTGTPIAHINLTNNTIVGNVLTVHTVPKGATFSSVGGGVYSSFILSQQAAPINNLTNNLIAQNDATSLGGGGGLYSFNAFATNDHNDFHGDLPNEILGDYTDAGVIGSNGNVSVNPVFVSAPVFWDHTNALGTSTTAVVFDSARYAVGNRIEYNDDGVSRQITSINSSTKTLTFTPALANKVCSNALNAACTTNADCLAPGTCNTATTVANRILANWGASTGVTEDLRLTAASPVLDAGTNTPLFGTVPSTDYSDLPRPADGDQNGSFITDIGAFEFRLPDGDGDGFPDENDCAPTVNSVWTAPSGVPAPLSISSSQVLSWVHIPQSNVYNVYSGTITAPFTYNPTCFLPEVPGLSASITSTTPPVGAAFYYLVGGVNSCGSGPIHTVATVNPPVACPPQNADTDGDTIQNLNDNCPTLANANQADPDHDTLGTVCDNCPSLYNPDQLDVNTNSIGDHCEDADSDTYPLVSDCNDTNPAVHPGATETCNGVDDNCVNGVDEGFDADLDGFTTCGGDCNDAVAAIHPGAPETCNGVDDNCVNGIDEGFDVDLDGFTTCGGDCNDAVAAIHPGATEICNGVDDNCAGGIDEGGDALCTDSDACTQDLCGGAGGCSHPPAGDGTPCSDGTACTQTDTCQSGVCTGGNPVICSAPDTCHDPGTCNPSSGICENAPSKPDGTSCEDGNACTAGDTCQSGSCQAGGLRDADADAHPDALCGGNDCNDANPLVWSPPSEVVNLTVTVSSPANPAWDSQSAASGPETVYDLSSGSFGPGAGLSFPTASCLMNGGTNSFSDARPDPAVGFAYWYLSRARNSCGTGTYGSVPRDTGIPACP
ncbi:MAG TPA: MopE-related protein [Candidatus Polarisedimenticolia bacterium]|nr:MopE-related protein [Candidatus Polarisedimenticolia bacterium]